MRKQFKNNHSKGQAVLEYIGLIGLVVLAFFALSMQDYFKRAMQGKLRQDITGLFGSEQYYGTSTTMDLDQSIIETWTVQGANQ